MHKTGIKTISVVLCLLLIYNSLGYFLVFSIIRASIRHHNWEKVAKLPIDRLTSFTFTKNSQQFEIINSREIKVDGKLYDIARCIDNGASLTFYCIHDKKEQNFLSKSRQFISDTQPLPVKKTAKDIIEKIIKNAFFENLAVLRLQENKVSSIHFFCINYSDPALTILIPPPQPIC